MRKHETISTKKYTFLIVILWIRESPHFIIFHAVLNFICRGGPRNAFAISPSRLFPNPIIYHFYSSQNIDTVLCISSQMLNIYIVLCILFYIHI